MILPPEIHSQVLSSLRRGVEPEELKASLAASGHDQAQIKALMGQAYEGRRSSREVDHAGLSQPALVRRIIPGGPLVRIASARVQIYAWRDFLDEAACAALVALTDRHLRQSTTADVFGDPAVRTSRTSDIGTFDDPLVRDLEDRICEAIGLHWSYSEPTQAQRYDPGQEFRAHHDYFVPGSADYKVYCQFLGQRTWTFMIYLNDVEEGGATRFRKIDRMFRPERGKALIWNNLNPDGSVNPMTLHQGMKVRAGRKYVITKWFRERGWGEMFL